MGIFAKPLGYILFWIYKLVGNYGISLIILTVLVKFLLYPLYRKQVKSTADMSEIAEKSKVIQERYANDKEKMNEAMQDLYAKEGFNPMSGCLPMLIQFPIIMGLFALLRNPILYMPESAGSMMIMAAHESFLWIDDLAQPDLWILPIIAGVSTYFSFAMNSAMMNMGGPQANAKSMNLIMKYVFPLSILWLARSYPAGLAIYWAGGQMLQIIFNIRINKLREEMRKEKEHKQIVKKAEKELEKKKRAHMVKVKGKVS
jgi:YidC/Oxa1 family membrane protein insertase